MASYFDEHDCEPLGPGEQPNHFLHLARLLLDSGVAALEGQMFGEKKAPPASKEAVEQLPTYSLSGTDLGKPCPVCLLEFAPDDMLKAMPCKHRFHASCILPWLQQTNSCPVCRHELPTDDTDYEEFKRQKGRAKDREARIEQLHDSMFG
ncbi:PREDICTED: E3 ubiquitin-protein ligase RNF181-like [Priapulus caudatus]|uniref:E3 ubiquitin-protein ligase RNF181-like n=1 Tax=Priapulus caudatus TaxID=37621 RepID=A0ABM1EUV6_PRICU|nr:PREDICTED: E3 ubiquitin-protein ligase RNF181-like [Priapulus caudatus]